MKVSILGALAALSPLAALAAPLASRAAAAEGPVGYASQNGGTTGGAGGSSVTVKSYDELVAAVKDDEAAIIYVEGTIEGSKKIKVGSNKSILGKNANSKLVGAGFLVKGAKNVIIQNMGFSKVYQDGGDAIAVQKSENVWIDHCDLSSDLSHGKDYYDGLADFSHAADYITVSNTYFHDHYKASLVSHSDSNAEEDTGKLHVTYANNHWKNINSRMPLIRFGTSHIFNSYYEGGSVGDTAINTRMGAQTLVESNVFVDIKDPLTSQFSKEEGYAVENDNDFGSAKNSAPAGTLKSVPYKYTLLGSKNVKAAVVGKAGQTLTLG